MNAYVLTATGLGVNTTSGDLEIKAKNNAVIDAVSFAASLAVAVGKIAISLSGAGAEATNVILGSTLAYIKDSLVDVEGALDIDAANSSTINASIVGVAASLAVGKIGVGIAIGVAIARNFIGWKNEESAKLAAGIKKLDDNNFYLGEYFQYKNSPWHYDFIWIVITIPISITIFFIVGFTRNFIKITKNFLSVDDKNHKFWSSNYEMLNYLFFIICFLVLFLKIKFGVSYDGWRQIYFLYPFIILVAIYGINYIIEVIKIFQLKNILFLFFFIEISYSCFWIYKYHPHQYVFFNPLFKNYVYEKIELDYWGLTNRSALEFISNSDERNEIKIATVSFTSLENTLYIMNKNDRKKFIVVHDLYRADYVIDNYRKKWNKTPGIDLMEKKFKKIYDLKIDGVIISSIYKEEK